MAAFFVEDVSSEQMKGLWQTVLPQNYQLSELLTQLVGIPNWLGIVI